MSKNSSTIALQAVFGFDANYMPDLSKSHRDQAMWLVSLGSNKLLSQVAGLMRLYPQLGWRPLRAGIYVFNEWVNLDKCHNGAGIFAETKHTDDGESHQVGCTEAGVYYCDCKDYQFNLGAIAVADGSFQQPCADIFAVALEDNKIYGRFVDA